MRTGFGLMALAAVLALPPGAFAQQASPLSALYDTDNPVTLVGEIVQVDWTPPRARLHVQDASTNQRWVILGGSPHDLSPEQRASVRVGDRVRVVAFQSRNRICDPACNGFGDTFTRADGSSLVTPPLPPHHP
ncbi:MAG: hypothetical protein GC155_15805 [Alphaproteobacteria bacterium]|nr:hypothetical protein [Alphaproteobacteria bacterium]